MSSRIRQVTFDTPDPYELASWWAQVLDGRLDEDDHPGDPAACVHGASVDVWFEEVHDEKRGKNRVHLDLEPAEGMRDAEIERLLGLGASLVDDLRRPDGSGWAVLADPEGNEFCVLRNVAERTAAERTAAQRTA